MWKVRDAIRIPTRSLLSGQHTLEVRSRSALLKEDPTPARIVFATGQGAAFRSKASVPAP